MGQDDKYIISPEIMKVDLLGKMFGSNLMTIWRFESLADFEYFEILSENQSSEII
jgi:hypothetical protein